MGGSTSREESSPSSNGTTGTAWTTTTSSTTNEEPTPAMEDATTKMEYHKTKEASLSGMELVNYKCRRKKRTYDRCVSEFYKSFMAGKSLDQEEACGDKFETYRECTLKGIRKEIWEKQGLPPPKDGSPLADVQEE